MYIPKVITIQVKSYSKTKIPEQGINITDAQSFEWVNKKVTKYGKYDVYSKEELEKGGWWLAHRSYVCIGEDEYVQSITCEYEQNAEEWAHRTAWCFVSCTVIFVTAMVLVFNYAKFR
jgi:hypothetical protein